MKIEPLVLDWNIEYELALNNGSPIEPTLLFLIPVKNQIVYMKLPFYKNEFSEGHVLLLDPVKFISVWRNSKNDSLFPGYHQGNEQMWRQDRKFAHIEKGFHNGKNHPHIIASGIFYDEQTGIGFNDSLTRTIWLLSNQAEYIPVFASNMQKATALKKVSGREYCSIYSCSDLLNHHFSALERQHQGLIP